MGRTCQTRTIREQRASELLLNGGKVSEVCAPYMQECMTHLEIRVRGRPAARADSGTDAVIDDVRELRFHGAEQGAAGARRNGWAVDDGVEDARSCGVVSEREQTLRWQRFNATGSQSEFEDVESPPCAHLSSTSVLCGAWRRKSDCRSSAPVVVGSRGSTTAFCDFSEYVLRTSSCDPGFRGAASFALRAAAYSYERRQQFNNTATGYSLTDVLLSVSAQRTNTFRSSSVLT
jgi:hypothetical protein